MKLISHVIERMAEDAYHNHMSGSMNSPFYGMDFDLVAFIYETDSQKVFNLTNKAFKKVLAERKGH
jgi:hypothetical protein